MASDTNSRRRFIASSAAALAALAAPALRAQSGGDPARIALVLGNDRYRDVPLGNCANDARAMADLLRKAGFRVDAHYDVDGKTLAETVRAFGDSVARPEVKLAFFYYAGHGVQVDWRNYLLPVDANIGSADELKRQCLDLGVLLGALAKAKGKEFVIVLDACRDNPLGAGWHPEQKGLSQFDAPVGSLIAFATAPGGTASDGGRQHGLYTENLVKELAVKDCKLEDALKRVRVSVRVASQGAQVPWESTSLESDVVLFPSNAPPVPVDDERRFEEELERWNAVKRSRNPGEVAEFIRQYPDGKFSEIAQTKLAAMLAFQGRMAEAARRTIEIGDGHPVPAFLGKSANPYSAGTYPLDRHFSVGDVAKYRELDGSGAERRTFVQRVTRIDEENDRVEFNNGTLVTDLLGNVLKNPFVEYDAPVQANPAELQVGKRWQARFHAARKGGEADVDMAFEIVARERVVVPAGEFDAFRIEGRGVAVKSGMEERTRSARGLRADRPARKPMGQGTEVTIWDVPGLNFIVKRVSTTRHRDGRIGTETIELVTLRQGAEGKKA
jgi:hypothetical protein